LVVYQDVGDIKQQFSNLRWRHLWVETTHCM